MPVPVNIAIMRYVDYHHCQEHSLKHYADSHPVTMIEGEACEALGMEIQSNPYMGVSQEMVLLKIYTLQLMWAARNHTMLGAPTDTHSKRFSGRLRCKILCE